MLSDIYNVHDTERTYSMCTRQLLHLQTLVRSQFCFWEASRPVEAFRFGAETQRRAFLFECVEEITSLCFIFISTIKHLIILLHTSCTGKVDA